MPSFLVTGAAGFIGSHSVDWLLEQGFNVVGVDNLRTGRLENLAEARLSPRLTCVVADASDEVVVRSLFEAHAFAGVLHLAALVSVPESFREPALNYQLNVAMVDQMARLCVEYGCKRFVFASSAGVYGGDAALPNRESIFPRPQSPYTTAKLASEVLLLGYAASYGLEVTCFRYFNVYGPRQDPRSPYSGVLSIFTDRLTRGLPVTIYGDGEQTRDFIFVRDVARANGTALTTNTPACGVYNLCTGYAASLNAILAVYQRLLPSSPPAQYDPVARVGDIRYSVGDPERLREALGLTAQTPLEKGLQALIASVQAAHA